MTEWLTHTHYNAQASSPQPRINPSWRSGMLSLRNPALVHGFEGRELVARYVDIINGKHNSWLKNRVCWFLISFWQLEPVVWGLEIMYLLSFISWLVTEQEIQKDQTVHLFLWINIKNSWKVPTNKCSIQSNYLNCHKSPHLFLDHLCINSSMHTALQQAFLIVCFRFVHTRIQQDTDGWEMWVCVIGPGLTLSAKAVSERCRPAAAICFQGDLNYRARPRDPGNRAISSLGAKLKMQPI